MDSRIVIAVDLDNVIADSDRVIRSIIHRISGVHLTQADIRCYDYHKVLAARGFELSEALRIEHEALETFHTQAAPDVTVVQGAQQGMSQLVSIGWHPVIVTSRPASSAEATRDWLRTKEISYKSILFTEDKAQTGSRWTILVEDAPHHATAASEAGVSVVLVDYPWNQGVGPSANIRRVGDWSEILEAIGQIGRR